MFLSILSKKNVYFKVYLIYTLSSILNSLFRQSFEQCAISSTLSNEMNQIARLPMLLCYWTYQTLISIQYAVAIGFRYTIILFWLTGLKYSYFTVVTFNLNWNVLKIRLTQVFYSGFPTRIKGEVVGILGPIVPKRFQSFESIKLNLLLKSSQLGICYF